MRTFTTKASIRIFEESQVLQDLFSAVDSVVLGPLAASCVVEEEEEEEELSWLWWTWASSSSILASRALRWFSRAVAVCSPLASSWNA